MSVIIRMNRPLTKNMLEQLMACHERELMNLEPYDVGTLHYCTGLLHKGMIATKTYMTKKGKQIIAFYVTNAGRRYLSKI